MYCESHYEPELSDKTKQIIQLRTALQNVEGRLVLADRKLAGHRYALCKMMTARYAYIPHVVGTMAAVDGLAHYSAKYYPDSMLRCACDSLK